MDSGRRKLADTPKREGLNPDIAPLIRCPVEGLALNMAGDELRCADGVHRYPLVDGVPRLTDEKTSVFGSSRTAAGVRGGPAGRFTRVRKYLASVLPSPSLNVAAAANYRRLAELLTTRTQSAPDTNEKVPAVLVIGGAIEGEGFAALREAGGMLLVETDVVIGPRDQIVRDAHDLPFASGSFDAVVCQAIANAP